MSMTTQEIFDKVVNHMRAQGNPWGNSRLRGWGYVNPDNPCQRCAKGILMDVEYYYSIYNEKNSGYRRKAFEYENKILYSGCNQLLDSLEVIFETKPMIVWEDDFKFIADKYNLVYTKQDIKTETKEGCKV